MWVKNRVRSREINWGLMEKLGTTVQPQPIRPQQPQGRPLSAGEQQRLAALNANNNEYSKVNGQKVYLNRAQAKEWSAQQKQLRDSKAYRGANQQAQVQMYQKARDKYYAQAYNQQQDANYVRTNLAKDEAWKRNYDAQIRRNPAAQRIAAAVQQDKNNYKKYSYNVGGTNVHLADAQIQEYENRMGQLRQSGAYRAASPTVRKKMEDDATAKYYTGVRDQRVAAFKKKQEALRQQQQKQQPPSPQTAAAIVTPPQVVATQQGAQPPAPAAAQTGLKRPATPPQGNQPPPQGGYVQNDPRRSGLSDDDARMVNNLTVKDIEGFNRSDTGDYRLGNGRVVGASTPVAKAIEAKAKQIGASTAGRSERFINGLSDQDFARIKMTGKGSVQIPAQLAYENRRVDRMVGADTPLAKAVRQRRLRMARMQQPAVQTPQVAMR